MSNIVIQEDDELMRSLLVEWLTAEGHRVSVSETARLSERETGDEADLVIVAVAEPRHTGAERLRRVRRLHPRARIILISGQFLPGRRYAGAAARLLGADGMVAKPFARTALLDAVRATIAAGA
jgi:DNA-binding response OmpR family regulator